MIARIWQGTVPKEKSLSYHKYVLQTGLKDYYTTEGNITAYLFIRDEEYITHFLILSLWRDYEAIQEFAGEDYEKARYYPEDEKFLLDLPPKVKHYKVLEPSYNLFNE